MKKLLILVLVLLLLLTAVAPAFAYEGGPPPGYGGPAQAEKQKRAEEEKQERKPVKDANTTADANSITETNEPNANQPAYKMYEGLEEALEDINQSGRTEISEWERGDVGNKIKLAKDVQEQITAELNFIRELAVEEGAAKTTAAIDGLLAYREKRSEEINEKLEEARRRQRAREERKDSRSRESRRRGSEGRRTRNRPLP